MARKPSIKCSFLAFYLKWAERQRWDVPGFHARVCDWLEHRGELAVLQMPRGHGKSTVLGVYNAWRYASEPSYRILHQGDQDGTAYKTSRDTKFVLQHHPWTQHVAITGEISFWSRDGNEDARNPSMQAAGILSNITSSRADEIQNDDVEVPNNIKTPDAREKLRFRLSEQIHILVPGGRQLFVGTPHTHETIYDEQIALGADALVLRMFASEYRIEEATKQRYAVGFVPDVVFSGIGKGARLLKQGVDYRMEGTAIVLSQPDGALVDCYAGALWPERFTAAELLKRRRKCKTINIWDSQYQLHAKPVIQTRLDPDRITPYDVEPTIRVANNAVAMFLGSVQIVAASLRWDPSSGDVKSDVSAAALVLQDDIGRRYLHRVIALIGEVVETDARGKPTGGQVWQLCDLIEQFQIPRVVIENNGIGKFAPASLKAALKARKLQCGVTEEASSASKNKRILESLEPLFLSSNQLWGHVDVLDGPFYTQCRDWNPVITTQPDDFLDAAAAACNDVPERIGKVVANTVAGERQDWRTAGGTFEVAVDY